MNVLTCAILGKEPLGPDLAPTCEKWQLLTLRFVRAPVTAHQTKHESHEAVGKMRA